MPNCIISVVSDLLSNKINSIEFILYWIIRACVIIRIINKSIFYWLYSQFSAKEYGSSYNLQSTLECFTQFGFNEIIWYSAGCVHHTNEQVLVWFVITHTRTTNSSEKYPTVKWTDNCCGLRQQKRKRNLNTKRKKNNNKTKILIW